MASTQRQDVGIGDHEPADGASGKASAAELLVEWQETGSHDAFAELFSKAVPRLTKVIAATLLGHGIKDPAAIDDALSLVLDHLRRLAGSIEDERRVGKFSPARASEASGERGWGYLRQLAHGRACDVARERRRQSPVLSQLTDEAGESFAEAIPGDTAGESVSPPLAERLHAAASSLEPRERLLVELLLEGKSQAVIAHVLGLNEGTVSRLRAQVIKSLRRIIGS